MENKNLAPHEPVVREGDSTPYNATAARSAAFTPGPWSHHVDIACKCGYISATDHPVAKVISGDWGDDYPSIRLIGGSLERSAEAYMEQITYGHIDQTEAKANARLIAAAPDLLEALTGLLAEYREWEAPRGGYAETHPAHLARAAIARATGADQ